MGESSVDDGYSWDAFQIKRGGVLLGSAVTPYDAREIARELSRVRSVALDYMRHYHAELAAGKSLRAQLEALRQSFDELQALYDESVGDLGERLEEYSCPHCGAAEGDCLHYPEDIR